MLGHSKSFHVLATDWTLDFPVNCTILNTFQMIGLFSFRYEKGKQFHFSEGCQKQQKCPAKLCTRCNILQKTVFGGMIAFFNKMYMIA